MNEQRTKYKTTTIWITSIFILLAALPDSLGETRVVCYYESWSVYRIGNAMFAPKDIDPYLCTHVVYAFVGITDENKLITLDEYADIDLKGFRNFTALKRVNPSLKTMLSVGGGSAGSAQFSSMAESSTFRKNFIDDAIRFLRDNDFDGMDIDWHYPGDNDKPQDKGNFAILIKEIREGFELEGETTNRDRLLISMTGPSEITRLDRGYDLPKLNRYIDWMNVLTYDYYAALDSSLNHHAPLYALDTDGSNDNNLNANYTISYFIKAGAEPEKLVLGIPTYGRSYVLLDPEETSFGSAADGPGEKGPGTEEPGYLAYFEICEMLNESMNNSNSDEVKWRVVNEDVTAVGPYAFNDREWVSFDDQNIIKVKAEYVAANKLGGVMFWSINNDDFHGKCHGKPFPLIESAKSTLIGLGILNETKRMGNISEVSNPLVPEDRNSSSSVDRISSNPSNIVNLSPPRVPIRKVVCYFESWTVYRMGVGKFRPIDIDPFLCTHLMYAFARISYNNIIPLDEYGDLIKMGYANFTGLKSVNSNLKTILSIGGANFDPAKFSEAANTSESRKTFSKNAIEFLRRYSFDGLDIDWEYPGAGERTQDKSKYPLLLKELREAMENDAISTGAPQLLLTIVVPSATDRIEIGYDIPELTRYVDWMNVLTYDYHTSSELSVNHHSPLYATSADVLDFGANRNLSVDYTINYYINSGADRTKLVLGIPSYARTYTLLNDNETNIGAFADGPGFKGDVTQQDGYLAYFEVCRNFDMTENTTDWTVVESSGNSMGPYAFNGNQWISYDDPRITKIKAEYAVEMNLGGVMFWSINNDDFNGNCTGEKFPLIKSAKEGLLEAESNEMEDKEDVSDMETNEPVSDKRVVCYYESWAVYRLGSATYAPKKIDPFLCTHIVYAFSIFTGDNRLGPADAYADFVLSGYANFTALKTKNPKLKTILSVGGSNAGSSKFPVVSEDATERAEFIKDTIKVVRENNFDGLDLDWQYPGANGRPQDRNNYALLVKELKEAFEKEAVDTGNSRLLLSMAIPSEMERIIRGFDIPKLNRYLDWMNILTYDYYSIFGSTSTNHHAPLYAVESETSESSTMHLSVDYTVTYLLNEGADSDKIVVGIPTYGRSYTLLDPEDNKFEAPIDNLGEKGDGTNEAGYLAFFEICEKIVAINGNGNDRWIVVQTDPNIVGPYAYKGNQWVAYDDPNIVKRKARYVVNKNLGGVMIWSINNDDFSGKCYGTPYPLIKAAKEGLNLITESQKPANPLALPQNTPSTEGYQTTMSTANSSTEKSTTNKPDIVEDPITMEEYPDIFVPDIVEMKTVIPIVVPDTTQRFEPAIQEDTPTTKIPQTTNKEVNRLPVTTLAPVVVDTQTMSTANSSTQKSTTNKPVIVEDPITMEEYPDIFVPDIVEMKTVIPMVVPDTTQRFEPAIQENTPTTKIPQKTNKKVNRLPVTTLAPVAVNTQKEVTKDMCNDLQGNNNPQIIMDLLTLLNKIGGIKELEKHLKNQRPSYPPPPPALPNETENDEITNNPIRNDHITPATISKTLIERILSKKKKEDKYTIVTDNDPTDSKRNGPVVYSNKTTDEDIEEKIHYSPKHNSKNPSYVKIVRRRPSVKTKDSDGNGDRTIEEIVEEYSSDDDDRDEDSLYTSLRRYRPKGNSPRYKIVKKVKSSKSETVTVEESGDGWDSQIWRPIFVL